MINRAQLCRKELESDIKNIMSQMLLLMKEVKSHYFNLASQSAFLPLKYGTFCIASPPRSHFDDKNNNYLVVLAINYICAA